VAAVLVDMGQHQIVPVMVVDVAGYITLMAAVRAQLEKMEAQVQALQIILLDQDVYTKIHSINQVIQLLFMLLAAVVAVLAFVDKAVMEVQEVGIQIVLVHK
jgi:hypothetical protein